MQVKVEREEFEEELKEMRERFSALRQEVDQVRNGAGNASEADSLRKVRWGCGEADGGYSGKKVSHDAQNCVKIYEDFYLRILLVLY